MCGRCYSAGTLIVLVFQTLVCGQTGRPERPNRRADAAPLAEPVQPNRRADAAPLARAAPLAADGSRYEFRDDHDPDGIGKFYMGREIAHVMGFQAAGWLERPEREKEEHSSKLIQALKLKPGDVVADVGAGSGYHTFRMAPVVAPKGKILAVDIQPEMIALLEKGKEKHKTQNVEPILGTLTDPKLPAAGVDLILLVDVYHEFSHPHEMTEAMVKALKPGGRMVFVEFRLEDPKVPIKLVHKMTQKQVIKEMGPHPLKHKETIEVLPWQHIIVFEKK